MIRDTVIRHHQTTARLLLLALLLQLLALLLPLQEKRGDEADSILLVVGRDSGNHGGDGERICCMIRFALFFYR
jgi:hypothetical protein